MGKKGYPLFLFTLNLTFNLMYNAITDYNNGKVLILILHTVYHSFTATYGTWYGIILKYITIFA